MNRDVWNLIFNDFIKRNKTKEVLFYEKDCFYRIIIVNYWGHWCWGNDCFWCSF
ncbi:hypothetical protein EMIT079MI2_210028 [Bacillus sp. IT-79MI2]